MQSRVICSHSTPALGVTFALDADRPKQEVIVVTYASLGVHVYDIKQSRCLKVWSVVAGSEFTCPAFQHAASRMYVAVKDDTTLCCWNASEEKLSKAACTDFGQSIRSIHGVFDDILIVFTDGSFVRINPVDVLNGECTVPSTSAEKKSTKSKKNAPASSYVWSDFIHNTGSSTAMFAIIRQLTSKSSSSSKGKKSSPVNTEYVLDLYKSTASGDKQLGSHTLHHPASSSSSSPSSSPSPSLSSAALQVWSDATATGGACGELSVSWSDGEWQVLVFDDSLSSSSSSSSSVFASPPRVSISRALTSSVNQSIVLPSASTAFFAPHCVAFLGNGTSNSDGATSSSDSDEAGNTNAITLWETRYGTLQKTHSLSSSVRSTPLSMHLSPVVSSMSSRRIVLSLADALVSVPVNLVNSSLAEVIGKMNQTSHYLQPTSQAQAARAPLSVVADPVSFFSTLQTMKTTKTQSKVASTSASASASASASSAAANGTEKGTPRRSKRRRSLSVTDDEGKEKENRGQNQDASESEPFDVQWREQLKEQDEREQQVLALLLGSDYAQSHSEGAADSNGKKKRKNSKSKSKSKNQASALLSPEKFNQVFSEYMEQLENQYASSVNVNKKLTKKANTQRKSAEGKASQARNRPILYSQNFVCKVASYVIDHAEQGLWEPLQHLVASNSVSASACPSLIPTLIKHKQFALIETCLIHVHDLPEFDLISILQLAIDTKKDSGDSGDSADNADNADIVERYLRLVVSAPKSTIFLQVAMKALMAPELYVVLAHLTGWLDFFWLSNSDRRNNNNSNSNSNNSNTNDDGTDGNGNGNDTASKKYRGRARIPSLAQVLDWIMLLLDAHFTEIVLFPNEETLALLRALKVLVTDEHLVLCEEMASLTGLLQSFEKQRRGLAPTPLAADHAVADYSMQVIEL